MPKVVEAYRIRELITVNTSLSGAEETRALLADTGAVLEGHFCLQGGRHSSFLLRFRSVGQDREAVDRVARSLIKACPPGVVSPTVICPESAGFFLGNAIAHQFPNSSLAVTRIDERRRPTELLRKGEIVPGSDVIVVNDVVTSGGSLAALMKAVRAHGAKVRAVLVFGTLDAGIFRRMLDEIDVPGAYLVEARWPTVAEPECQQCLRGNEPLLPSAEFN